MNDAQKKPKPTTVVTRKRMTLQDVRPGQAFVVAEKEAPSCFYIMSTSDRVHQIRVGESQNGWLELDGEKPAIEVTLVEPRMELKDAGKEIERAQAGDVILCGMHAMNEWGWYTYDMPAICCGHTDDGKYHIITNRKGSDIIESHMGYVGPMRRATLAHASWYPRKEYEVNQ